MTHAADALAIELSVLCGRLDSAVRHEDVAAVMLCTEALDALAPRLGPQHLAAIRQAQDGLDRAELMLQQAASRLRDESRRDDHWRMAYGQAGQGVN
jgi:hypothetical protein